MIQSKFSSCSSEGTVLAGFEMRLLCFFSLSYCPGDVPYLYLGKRFSYVLRQQYFTERILGRDNRRRGGGESLEKGLCS